MCMCESVHIYMYVLEINIYFSHIIFCRNVQKSFQDRFFRAQNVEHIQNIKWDKDNLLRDELQRYRLPDARSNTLIQAIQNFSQRIRAKVADSGRSAKVSYRALSLEAMRLVVRQFLKWPAEAFPRGRHPWPCWNFLNLLPAAETFRTSWKIARVSLHGHSFSGAISVSFQDV